MIRIHKSFTEALPTTKQKISGLKGTNSIKDYYDSLDDNAPIKVLLDKLANNSNFGDETGIPTFAQLGALESQYNEKVIRYTEDFLTWPSLYTGTYHDNIKHFIYAVRILAVLNDRRMLKQYYPNLSKDDEKLKEFKSEAMPGGNSVAQYGVLSTAVKKYDDIERKANDSPSFNDILLDLADETGYKSTVNLIINMVKLLNSGSDLTKAPYTELPENQIAQIRTLFEESNKLYSEWKDKANDITVEDMFSIGNSKFVEDKSFRRFAKFLSRSVPFNTSGDLVDAVTEYYEKQKEQSQNATNTDDNPTIRWTEQGLVDANNNPVNVYDKQGRQYNIETKRLILP